MGMLLVGFTLLVSHAAISRSSIKSIPLLLDRGQPNVDAWHGVIVWQPHICTTCQAAIRRETVLFLAVNNLFELWAGGIGSN